MLKKLKLELKNIQLFCSWLIKTYKSPEENSLNETLTLTSFAHLKMNDSKGNYKMFLIREHKLPFVK